MLPFGARRFGRGQSTPFELRTPSSLQGVSAALYRQRIAVTEPRAVVGDSYAQAGELDDCGGDPHSEPESQTDGGRGEPRESDFEEDLLARFRIGDRSRVRLTLPYELTPLTLSIEIPAAARAGSNGVVDFIQLDARSRPVGGLAFDLHVTQT